MTDGIVIDMGELAKRMQINIRVSGLRRFTVRLKFAMGIMRLASWIAGMPIKVDTEIKE